MRCRYDKEPDLLRAMGSIRLIELLFFFFAVLESLAFSLTTSLAATLRQWQPEFMLGDLTDRPGWIYGAGMMII